MIAQIVFDLPIDGPFDYLIPEELLAPMTVGKRVKVSFGAGSQIGFVVGLQEKSEIAKLKPVLSLCDSSPVFNNLDLDFARDFSAYYGCSLGEALFTICRNKQELKPSICRERKVQLSIFRVPPASYAAKIQEIIDEYRRQSSSLTKDSKDADAVSFLILVPDTFLGQLLYQQLHALPLSLTSQAGSLSLQKREVKGGGFIKIGMRSSVFECDGQYDCVIMVDEEDSSYKQEQVPMYETRQVLLMRSKIYGFDVAFVGISTSVELMALVRESKVKSFEGPTASVPSSRLVDLTNYKFVPGLISPALREALEVTLKAGLKSILVINRRGSYRLTRCVDCAEILKCSHCDSSLIYSRIEGKFLCRHCTYTLPGSTVCPKCHKPSWKSVGIGVEQLQTELKKIFPLAKVLAFERSKQDSLPDFDILISTSAVLRFQGALKVKLAAFIDFDSELNRLDMRSAFNAFSLAYHIGSMSESIFIQTRNVNHYVLQSLSSGKPQDFYDEELKLRKEFGFTPFKHWVKINWRGKIEKATHEAALQAYHALSQSRPHECTITPPLADIVGRKRDQFRFNVMVQTNEVPKAVAFIKTTIAKLKRPSRVIMTLNIDP